MVPTAFNEENATLDAPPGMENCDPLPVYCGRCTNGHPMIVSCWKFTEDEIEEIKRTGRLWLVVHGSVMVPVSLTGTYPFAEDIYKPTEGE